MRILIVAIFASIGVYLVAGFNMPLALAFITCHIVVGNHAIINKINNK